MLKFTANLSLLFTEIPFSERFQAAKESGFDAVEIQFPYSLSAKKIKGLLDENELKLILFNVDADDLLQGGEGLSAVPKKQKQFRKALIKTQQYAKILQPEVINILAGCCFDESQKTQYLSTFKQNLNFALETFSPLGIKTVFEAINTVDMPQFLIDSGKQMLAIQQEMNHADLLMQYDIYHLSKMGENCVEFIKNYADKIGHIQFADVPNRGQPNTGTLNFKALFSAIEKSNYQGWVGAEYHPVGVTSKSFGWRDF